MTIEVVYDHATDHETKADSVCVDLLLFVLVGAEEHKHVLMVGLLDSLTAVFD